MELKENEHRVACRGCHGGCVHILTVEDGKVTAIRPDDDAPLNHGRACAKGVTVMEQMYHPDRLLHPLKRMGERGSGKWERISWEEAYDIIATRLSRLKEEYGAECISAITGTGRHMVPYLWRFTKAIGTPNITSAGALICLGPRKNAGFSTSGAYNCVDYYGEVKPKCILVWGANPTVSGADGELQWHPRECGRNGTRFVVVDPMETELAKQAEVWLRLRPGTDGALALGILNVLIEEDLYDHEFVDNWTYGFGQLKERCREYPLERVEEITWVPKEDIRKAARILAEEKPMSLEWGCAFEQCFNATQTCRAIYMIPALTGNYDVPGGFVESKHIVKFKRDPIEPHPRLVNDYPYRSLKPYAHPNQILNSIQTGSPYRIRAMMCFANNSLLSLPDSKKVYECLKEVEFLVSMDIFMTPTAAVSDIVLPAALWPEVDALVLLPEFTEHSILCQHKVVQVGECRTDEEVFIEICKRMGVDYGAGSQRELLDMELKNMAGNCPELEGMDFEKMSRIGYFTPKRTYYNYKRRGGFDTPTGKFEFYSKEVEQLGGDPLPFWTEPPVTPYSRPDLKHDYPYVLTTGTRRQQYFISNNRQIKSLRRQYPFPHVRLHPDTAARHGIREGDWVYISTSKGRITQKAELDPDMDPRVVNCDFAWWYPEAGAPGYGWDESNANVLTSCDNGCDSYMGSYQLRGILCNIYKNEHCGIEERYYKSKYYETMQKDTSSPCVEIDPDKCILCGECVRTCRKVQGIAALEIRTVRGMTRVCARNAENISGTGCVGCGQCRASCNTGAMHIKTDVEMVREAIADKDTVTIVQVAPSVRVGVGGNRGFEAGANSMEHLVGALYRLGFDHVYDTVFGADLTVVEEADEFLDRLSNGGPLPLLTSCCPAWVKFCEENYPEFFANISTCRSPQQMLGAVLRDYYKEDAEREGKKVVSVSVMPCTAKKAEILRQESCTDGRRDIDYSLTTVEFLEMMEQEGICAEDCAPRQPEHPFSTGSGAGTIFGVTGGVTEAVLRYLSPKFGIEKIDWIYDSGVRGGAGIKKVRIALPERNVDIAVVSGLNHARELLEKVKTKEEHYDLIEVMACPGGCVMGGGQPVSLYGQRKNQSDRTGGLYHADGASEVRRPQDNGEIRDTYARIMEGRRHTLLHRNFP